MATNSKSSNGVGPQCPSDNAFRRRVRLHQSWYRDVVLDVPYGSGPRKSSKTLYGNMLTADSACEGLNFISSEIFTLAKNRLNERRGGVEPFRLLRNMLSSQPMSFNLFGPVALNPDFNTKLVQSIWGSHIEKVTDVKFEWAPTPIREYLNDRTAFDVFIEYESSTGPGFIGIETKLSEEIASKKRVKPEYTRWMSEDGPWKSNAYPQCSERLYNQLWRNHLLSWALVNQRASEYVHGFSTIVRHQDDLQCKNAVNGYRALLRDKESFTSIDLQTFVLAWCDILPDWADHFKSRYVDL